jgi:hypothetical protein
VRLEAADAVDVATTEVALAAEVELLLPVGLLDLCI